MSFIAGCICGSILTACAMSQTIRTAVLTGTASLWQKITGKTPQA